mmetsp:Transcript_9034/g.8494  ORF Transcript_9034/g.8494 Transcript_9034/m.8494 type:complete len:116 (-) Transcript_9034:1323-1670(-)
MPASLTQDADYIVHSSPEDFVFAYVEDQSFYHLKPKSGVYSLCVFTDYEGGGAISVSNDFILVSYSYDFVFTVGIQYDTLDKIKEEGSNPLKPIPESDQSFTKLEIWTVSSQAVA